MLRFDKASVSTLDWNADSSSFGLDLFGLTIWKNVIGDLVDGQQYHYVEIQQSPPASQVDMMDVSVSELLTFID